MPRPTSTLAALLRWVGRARGGQITLNWRLLLALLVNLLIWYGLLSIIASR
jgi:hypothetical protein